MWYIMPNRKAHSNPFSSAAVARQHMMISEGFANAFKKPTDEKSSGMDGLHCTFGAFKALRDARTWPHLVSKFVRITIRSLDKAVLKIGNALHCNASVYIVRGI